MKELLMYNQDYIDYLHQTYPVAKETEITTMAKTQTPRTLTVAELAAQVADLKGSLAALLAKNDPDQRTTRRLDTNLAAPRLDSVRQLQGRKLQQTGLKTRTTTLTGEVLAGLKGTNVWRTSEMRVYVPMLINSSDGTEMDLVGKEVTLDLPLPANEADMADLQPKDFVKFVYSSRKTKLWPDGEISTTLRGYFVSRARGGKGSKMVEVFHSQKGFAVTGEMVPVEGYEKLPQYAVAIAEYDARF